MKSTDHSTALVLIVCCTKRVLVLHYFIVPDDRYQATTFKIMAVLSDVYSCKCNENPSCKYFIVPRLLVPLNCQSFPRPFRIKVLRVLFSFEEVTNLWRIPIVSNNRLRFIRRTQLKSVFVLIDQLRTKGKKFVCEIHPLTDLLCKRKHD